MRWFFVLLLMGCATPRVSVAVLSPPLYDIKEVRSLGLLPAVGYGERHPSQARYITERLATTLRRSKIYRRVKLAQLTEPAEAPLSADVVKDLCKRLKVSHVAVIRVGYLDIRTRLDVGPYPRFGSYRWYLSGIMRTSVVVYGGEGRLALPPRTIEVTCASTSPTIPDERAALVDLCEQTALHIWRLFCPSVKRIKRRLIEATDPAIARAIDAVVCDAPFTAVDYLRFAVETHPDSLAAHYNLAACSELLGTVYLQEDKIEEALAAFQQALQHYRIAAKISPTTRFAHEIAQVTSTIRTLTLIISRVRPGPPRGPQTHKPPGKSPSPAKRKKESPR